LKAAAAGQQQAQPVCRARRHAEHCTSPFLATSGANAHQFVPDGAGKYQAPPPGGASVSNYAQIAYQTVKVLAGSVVEGFSQGADVERTLMATYHQQNANNNEDKSQKKVDDGDIAMDDVVLSEEKLYV